METKGEMRRSIDEASRTEAPRPTDTESMGLTTPLGEAAKELELVRIRNRMCPKGASAGAWNRNLHPSQFSSPSSIGLAEPKGVRVKLCEIAEAESIETSGTRCCL